MYRTANPMIVAVTPATSAGRCHAGSEGLGHASAPKVSAPAIEKR